MTSFALRESLLYCRENSSKVYLCYLDGKQAFDHVWHPGLLHKLIQIGVDDTTLLTLRAMYKGSLSQVRYQGQLSETFTVQQGTKQGGKRSPLMYLVYINGLIKELVASGYGMCIYDQNICSLTVADDMVLVSLSKSSMDAMLNMCWEYSRKWRYFYNADKCKIVVFNEKRKPKDSRFYIGQTLSRRAMNIVISVLHVTRT